MQIDWVTVAAQVVNFLILVYVLKRFLYRPVLAAMERRRRNVAERLEEAERRERTAEDARARYERQLRDLEHSKDALLVEARNDAQRERNVRLEQARREVGVARQDWRQDLEREREDTHNRLRMAVAESALEVARHLLSELSGADLERRMAERLLTRLADLDGQQREDLRKGGSPVRIRSAFELEPDLRTRITHVVHEHIGDDLDVEYALAPGLLGGLELSAGGLRIGWTLADHIEGLDLRLAAALRSRARAGDQIDVQSANYARAAEPAGG